MKAAQFLHDPKSTATADISDTLPSLLGKAKSSHDPVLVYDGEKNFKGVFWPYFALFHKRPNSQSKAESLMGPAASISPEISVFRIVEAMLSSRLYKLPVVENGTVTGIVDAGDIIKFFLNSSKNRQNYLAGIKPRKMLTVDKNEEIKVVYSKMRRNNRTRAVVVGEKGQVSGIISRRDIYQNIAWPAVFSRMKQKKGKSKQLLFDKEWDKKLEHKVRSLMNQEVKMLPEDSDMESIVREIIKGDGGSIILVDRDMKPVSIVSRRDLLKAVMAIELVDMIPVKIVDKNKMFGYFRLLELERMLAREGRKIDKVKNVSRIEVVVSAAKNPAGRISEYEMRQTVFFNKGSNIIVTASGHTVRKTVNMLIDKALSVAQKP